MSQADNIQRHILRLKDEIIKEVNTVLPRKVGILAVNHFRNNFRQGGFVNNGLQPWKRTRRQEEGGKDSKYSPLTSRRNHLMRSLQYQVGVGEVTITNPVDYAGIHNEGGIINSHPTVTPKMRASRMQSQARLSYAEAQPHLSKLRKFAWAKVYALSGVRGKGKLPKDLPEAARRWKAIALTRKSKLSVTARIPKRQFIGQSHELDEKVKKEVMKSIEKIQAKLQNGIRNM